jgi:hypothetical protein
MLIRNTSITVAATMVLAAATVWAQSTAPAGAPNGALAGPRAAAARKTSTEKMVNPASATAMHQRLEEMEGTLNKMHALLKQMHAKAAASGSKDSLAKANLDMWELMVGELDKQFEQLRSATLMREDIEARRNAMYKSASGKAEAAAAQARQAMAAEAAGHATPVVSGDQHAPATGGQAQPATPAPPSAATK